MSYRFDGASAPRRHIRISRGTTLALCVCAFAAASALAAPAGAAALTVGGVSLPQSVKIGGQYLTPLSCGVRDTLWIEHYVSALYVPRGASASVLLDDSKPVAVLLRILDARYLPGTIPDKWLPSLERSMPPRQLSSIRRAYRRLSEGDRVLMEYRPDRGVTMRVNGRAVAHVPGRAVIDAIMAAWAGDKAPDEKLRELQEEHPCPRPPE